MKKIYTRGIIALLSFIFSGCANKKSPDHNAVVVEQEQLKTITMGTSADYPPFEFKKQGEYVGIDIEIAKAITDRLNYRLEIVDLDFGSLVGSVKSGRVDFVASALTETPERLKSIDFSDVYYEAEIAVIYKIGPSFNKPKDFENKTIGTQLGSTMEVYLRKIAREHPSIEIKTLNKNPELIQGLKLGKFDAVLLEETQAHEFVKKNPGLTYNPIPGTGEGYAIGFKKGSSELVNQFNTVLRALKKDGTLAKIKEKRIKNLEE